MRGIEELFVYLVMFGGLVGDGFETVVVKAVKAGPLHGHQNGGMGGDDELGMAGAAQFVEEAAQLQLGFGRQGGFGFIQKMQPLDLVNGLEIGHARLSMGESYQ